MGMALRDMQEQVKHRLARYARDPYKFVMYAYPWGVKGTRLEDETGPDTWQKQILKDIGHAITHGWVFNKGKRIDCTSGIYIAVSSGHGVGKSALMAMIDDWWMSTKPHCQVVTTANTKDQLTTKTWREKSKWHKLLINRSWFEWTATRFKCLADPETWFSAAIPWSDRKPESFAGTHEKYVLVKYDEASAIPDIIWETTEGAFTDSNGIKIWIVFGNPTQNTGRFAQCFKKERDRWIKYNIDSRTSNRTDKKLIERWIQLYGEDSDFVRIRVKGEFPRSGSKQFIGNDLVDDSAGKVIHPSSYHNAPKILGVDIARYGDDNTVFIRRQGKAAYGIKRFSKLNTQSCAGMIAQEVKEWQPDQVFLDMGNTGAAVYDLITGWGKHYEKLVTGVWFGSKADDEATYFNKRVEMWGRMRDWLPGAGIPDDEELKDDLIGPEYGFSSREQFQLESKKDMKARGLASPDIADALALTFAYPVTPKNRPDTNDANHSVTHEKLFGYNSPKPQKTGMGVFYD